MMIYVNSEWLSATEALDQLIKLNNNSHKIFTVRCDFCLSKKCRKEYPVEYRRYLKLLNENDNKIICIFCSRTLKFSGRNNPNTKYNHIDDNYFKIIDSEEKAYVLGWIASDGSISNNKIALFISEKDKKIIKTLKNIIAPEIPLKTLKRSPNNLIGFTISSKEIQNDLCKLLQIKPGKKDFYIRIPSLSNDLIIHFIRGYFDGDGSVSSKNTKKNIPRANIASTSSKMLDDIYGVIGYKTHISKEKIEWDGEKALDFLSKIYDKASPQLRLQRKYNLYKYWKQKEQNE